MNDSLLLVVGLYAYDDLLDHAIRSFEGFELFNGLADPGNKLIWECIRGTYLTTGAKPTVRLLTHQCQTHLITLDLSARSRAEVQIAATIARIADGTYLLRREHVQTLLANAGRRAAVDKMLAVGSLEDNSADALVAHVDSVSTMLQNVVPKRSVRKRALAQSERSRLLRFNERWEWGIDYWDAAGLTWYKKEIHGLLGPTGGGKCLGPEVEVLMYDGTVKAAKDVVVGDLLMGPDSTPRKVLSTCAGAGPMYRIHPVKGDSWTCNDAHILTLVNTTTAAIVDIELREYLNMPKPFKHMHEQFSVDVEFLPARAYSNTAVLPGHGIQQVQLDAVQCAGFAVEHIGIGPYNGWEIDGDRRFLLADGTVTHNTVNMTNIATRQLKYGRKVLIVLYEQALEEDVEQRIIGNLAGINLNELRNKNEEDIDPKIQERINHVCSKYEDNLVVFDMVGEDAGNGGVAELKAQIKEEEQATGFVPDLIIIDWLGEMVMRYSGLGDSDAAYRRTCEKFMSELVQFKEDHGSTLVVLHQTNTAAQGMSPTGKPNKTMAHEFRSFANKCDSCSVLGVMDRQSKVCWFIPDKSRRSSSQDRIIQLDGNYMRFNDVSSKYVAVGPSFVKASDLEEQERPVTARPQEEDY